MDYKETAEVRKIKAEGEKVAAGDGTQILSYINHVLIKISLNDVIGKPSKGVQRDYIEQLFKITKYTTFTDLKKEAVNFWGLEK